MPPMSAVSHKYAEIRIRSSTEPDMIEPVVQENSTKAAQKTPVMLSPRFGPAEPSHGKPYWSPQK